MHLESIRPQQVYLPTNALGPALTLRFRRGDTIHTENSYKFNTAAVAALLASAGFRPQQSWQDPNDLFAVTLAAAV